MAKFMLAIGYVLKPFLFKSFKIKIIGNEVYSDNTLIAIGPNPKAVAIAHCMSYFKLVQKLLLACYCQRS